jgi:hypothetical protein
VPGALIIVGYLTFIAALAVSVAEKTVSPVTAVVPAAAVGAAGAVLLAWPPGGKAKGSMWQRGSVLPGWDAGRLWKSPSSSRRRSPHVTRSPGRT